MPSTQGIRAGRAFVELFAEDSQLVRGLRRAQKRLKAFGDRVRNLGLKVAGVGAAVLTPLLGAARAFSRMGDQVAKMAKRTGLSVETLSEMRFVASQTGTEFESLEMAFRRMQRSIYDAGRGLSTASDALTDLGLRFEDLEELSPEQQFKLLGEALSRIADPTKKAAIAMTLFGRTGTSLLPMFARGAAGIEELQQEARRLGLTMSGTDAKAAEDFTDALDKLWKVVSMGVFRIGAALAPTLQRLADTITSVAVRISAWIDQNRGLVVSVAWIAAAALAGGVALTVLGTTLGGLASATGTLATIVTGVASAFTLLGSLLGALISPIGLTISAVAALGSYLVYATGVGGKALAWLGGKFNVLRDDAQTAFSAIASALAAGDVSLAAKVLWQSLKLEWARGVNALQKIWLDLSTFLQRGFADAWSGMLAVAENAWHALSVGWIEVVSGLGKAWIKLQQAFAESWEYMKGIARKAAVSIRGLWDDTTAEAREEIRQEIDLQTAQAIVRIDQETGKALNKEEAQRVARRGEAQRLHEATLAEIGQGNLDRRARLDAEYQQRLAAHEADLAAAREERDRAIAAANRSRPLYGRDGGGPESLKSPEDLIGRINNALSSLGDQAARIGARGTFSAASLLGLQAGGVTDRMASGIDRIERNTRPLRDAQQLSFT